MHSILEKKNEKFEMNKKKSKGYGFSINSKLFGRHLKNIVTSRVWDRNDSIVYNLLDLIIIEFQLLIFT